MLSGQPNSHSPPLSETLRTVTINGTPITIKVVSDGHPDMVLAHLLWYEVYVEDLKYNLTEGVDHTERKLCSEPNGSLVFLAMEGKSCVGTIRTTHEETAELEFDYKFYPFNKAIIEVTKMVVTKRLRHSALKGHLMNETQEYNKKLYSDYYIVMNTSTKMVAFYSAMYFFKLNDKKIVHPIIKNESYLMACTKDNFDKVCSDLEKIIAGALLLKLKLGLKYWWYKTKTNALNNVKGN